MTKHLLAAYLVFFRGYSVMRVGDDCTCWSADVDGWAACSAPMEFDYGHNSGAWATGATPQDAVINCWRKTR